MNHPELDRLRNELDELNKELLTLINQRGELVQKIGKIKNAQGIKKYDPVRERHMLDLIASENKGPFETSTLQHLFKEIFKAGLELQEDDHRKALLVSRKQRSQNTIIPVKGTEIGSGNPVLIAGPCAVESYEQTAEVAKAVTDNGLSILRGGAFKPRTSPYDFQGLGIEGLKILKKVADEYNCAVISEIVHPDDLDTASEYLDIIQIGARNMQNYELLKAAGKVDKPILLKRGLAATIEEFIYSAEYIMSQGNGQIILCERGIRTYERATRNTLDITAVPILKQETHLPVFVDVTHSTGRKDLLLPAAKAALAIGADGVMAEVHPDPSVALSDALQQMNINEFENFVGELVKTGFLKMNQMV
ncbi:bifunctional 3-deoxy-7-phosphoheptulonate synthase/chorismate mutase [Fictibacillus phosphorivorans]|uniref:bifunctional 3-deoxy-7-phosphoheptulonate synthase/chorismate mutase n=1 Tax=Fictibacillus phosphorivorans TaxID=1221500 RepID=UPI00203EEED5|nr:bifunctional 3-deoxy-7-phosphoheptulonate synthase/chorismate mutase [Fictibacillus phosphorivorans]MCM3717967.1 bifunctional 3-deoxy-7-phosphoheptulonate synthase/chorismate mutase [Fictibacillus phosphorivorans]MCM3775416.1 bifunctional 3-deoxy-7-phosphoheptulonate synthase/chorismate mutase [Fictibacillus phosphorivorans]